MILYLKEFQHSKFLKIQILRVSYKKLFLIKKKEWSAIIDVLYENISYACLTTNL